MANPQEATKGGGGAKAEREATAAAAEAEVVKKASADKSKASETSFNAETGIVTVTTTDPESGRSAVIRYELGKTIEEAAAKLGGAIALEKLSREISRNLSNNGRSRLKAGKSPEEVSAELANWKPGMSAPRAPRASFQDQLVNELGNLTPEQQLAKLQELLAKAKSAA